ncbi:MAG TPA: tetratricopeptide repeat protein [Burkholderiales bacterium]|nr:tetratricopeptide repeat protein [Burkholderiales bacterium]
MIEAAAQRWKRITGSPSTDVNLAEGALLIAAEAYEHLDVDAYLRKIDEMGATLRRRLRSDISTSEALLALNRYVFDELGFSGNAAHYYDPRNSYLNEVIDRRLGIPITLAVLYIEIGRRIGLPLHGVSFPAHFLVKCVLREGSIIIDPYARGASLGVGDLQERLKGVARGVELDDALMSSLLAAAEPREILARMLRNLRAIHLRQGEKLRALAASSRIVELVPGAAEEYRDRGELYAELECARAAVADLRQYLKLKPQASDSEHVARRVAELENLAARLN